VFIAVYDADGKIFKGLQGDDLLWARRLIEEEWPGDWLYSETDHLVDNSCEKVDVTVDPPVLVPFTPAKTPEEIKAEILAATQRRLDEFARSRNYDGILSAATYAGSGGGAVRCRGATGC
jgi:hypothetical protein